ncbi:MAG: ABC transporter permease [Acidobacteria bacterium]|nr:ABC transporter permease [Acidobacteriota bacterium]
MQIKESVRTSLEEIRAHKLRSMLTLSGVILGTVALVVVLSLLNGVRAGVEKGINDLGFDGVLYVSQKRPVDRLQQQKAHFSKGLREEDRDAFGSAQETTVPAAVAEGEGIISANKLLRKASVYGVTPEYAFARNRSAEFGRFISERDQVGVRPVCVLGYELKQKLFGTKNAIGEQITLSGRRLEVVGVVRKFDTTFVNDDDMFREMRGLYVPLSTYETIYGRNSVSYMILKASQFERSVEAEDETKGIMTRAHNGIKDVNVTNVGKEILEEREKIDVILRNWTIVFFSIAGVSLIIGGVGIFSVLKISIGERLYEIGLRKAMGASDGEIFFQFLIESMTLSTMGATIGGGLGVLLVFAIGSNFPGGLMVSLPGILIAGGFAVGIGLTAGLYPSVVASRLEPVEALRA